MKDENKCRMCNKEVMDKERASFCSFCGNMLEEGKIDQRQGKASDLKDYKLFYTHYRNAPSDDVKKKIEHALVALKTSWGLVLAEQVRRCIASDEREAQAFYEENEVLSKRLYDKELVISGLEDEIKRLEGIQGV